MPFAIALIALLFAALALAWYDGGREDLREISVPVAVPGDAQ
jgi:hypothetical protein